MTEPDSGSGVARRIGMPRQQVNYHLRELEKPGLVKFVEERTCRLDPTLKQ
jgi:biotin operon repressor